MDNESIEDRREEIARIDAELVKLIAKRTDAAEEIGRLKEKNGLPVRDLCAEGKVLDRFKSMAAEYGLPEDRLRSIAVTLMDIAIEREERIQKND